MPGPETMEVEVTAARRSQVTLYHLRRPARGASHISVIVPTRDAEEATIELLAALRETCNQLAVEVIVVDDSDEPSWRVGLLAQRLATPIYSVRLIRRRPGGESADGRPTALQEGLARARAPYVAMLDLDADWRCSIGQLTRLYQAAVIHSADVAMSAGPPRADSDRESRTALPLHYVQHAALTWAAKLLFPEHLLRLTDPLGDCILFRRAIVADLDLPQAGPNLSLDLLLRAPWATLVEVPTDRESADGPARPAPHRQTAGMRRQLGRLWRTVPSAGLRWKITLAWLLGGLMSLIPFGSLLALRRPGWLAWLATIETLLLCVACVEERNANHALRPKALGRRWVTEHSWRLAALGAHAATMFFLSNILRSWPAALGGATIISLAVCHLLDPAEARRRVLATNAASTADETMLIGKEDLARQPIIALMTVSALVAGIITISQAQLGPIVTVVALVLGAAALLQLRINRDKAITVVLALATAIAALDYAAWRVLMTNWAAWFIAVPLLLAEALGMFHTLGLQWTLWPRKAPRVRRAEDPTHRPIFIFIPTVNEGAAVLEPSVRAAQRARSAYLAQHPHGRVEIVLCNDGMLAHAPNAREPELLARRLGVKCITRATGGGAKAGNIENARQIVGATGDALIVVFDADQVAHPDFLLRTVQPFSDPSIGWVQTGQYYSNTDNPVARWANDQQALFYRLLCPGKASHNAAFICGTNVMIRAAALDEIGGLPQDSVTEDFAASIQLHPRWRSVYLSDVLAKGLGPMDLGAYFKQQRRWAIGTLSVLRTHWRAILLPRRRGLRPAQRLQYALACTHYLSGIRDLVYIVAPLVYVAFGLSAVKGARLDTFLWHFLPYWCASMSAFIYAAWKKTGWRGVVVGFASFPVLVGATLAVLFGRGAAFTVTSKRRADRISLAAVAPLALACAATLAALIWNWRHHDLLVGTAFFVQMWLAYITLMLALSLWLAVHDMLYQRSWRRASQPSRAQVSQRNRQPRVRASGIRPSLAAVFCLVVLASDCGLSGAEVQGHLPPVTPASIVMQQAPYLGIAGDTAVLARDVPLLEAHQSLRFGIVGRTQNVTDHFDATWANELSAHGAYPWITLQFGHYEADGSPSLDASLAAIANGQHDADIERLAREIREFGKPVLLTILPNTDRDWSLSSAVANGGIPADTARAWKHVYTLFQAAGASNVSWVWAPKDPAHDDAFAPPDPLYSVVLVNVTYNPDGITDDPAIVADVTAHHPDKPVLVETTSVHADRNEGAWLQQLAAVVSGNHAIKGLLYFDGAPGERPRQAPAPPVDTSLLRWAQQTLPTLASTSPTAAHAR